MATKLDYAIRELHESEEKFVNKLRLLLPCLRHLNNENNDEKLLESNLARLLGPIQQIETFHTGSSE